MKHEPKFEGVLFGHAVNLCRSFAPSLVPLYDIDDLLQEAYLVFARCKERSRATSARWFMGYYSHCLRNRFLTLVTSVKKYNLVMAHECEMLEQPPDEGADVAGFRLVQLCELAPNVRDLLEIYTSPNTGKRLRCSKDSSKSSALRRDAFFKLQLILGDCNG